MTNNKHIEFTMSAIKLQSSDGYVPVKYMTDGYDGYGIAEIVYWTCYDTPDFNATNSGWAKTDLFKIKIVNSREVYQTKPISKWGPVRTILPL